MSLLSFFSWIGTIPACFNSGGNTFVDARIKIFSYKLSNQTFVQFNDLSGNIFLLARLFNVEITDNLFNFITASSSELKGWIEPFSFDFYYTQVFAERVNCRHNRIKIVACRRKRLGFWYVQNEYYIKEKLIKCLAELRVTRYDFTIINEVIFSSIDEFWVNNGRTVLQKLLLSVIFSVSRFSR